MEAKKGNDWPFIRSQKQRLDNDGIPYLLHPMIKPTTQRSLTMIRETRFLVDQTNNLINTINSKHLL